MKYIWYYNVYTLIYFFFPRVNFINDNEILEAHRQLGANQAPKMGLFYTI